MNKVRVLEVTNSEGFHETLVFDSEVMKDSEAFKDFLCEFDPGDNYTVKFSNCTHLNTETFKIGNRFYDECTDCGAVRKKLDD